MKLPPTYLHSSWEQLLSPHWTSLPNIHKSPHSFNEGEKTSGRELSNELLWFPISRHIWSQISVPVTQIAKNFPKTIELQNFKNVFDCQVCQLGQFSKALYFPLFNWGKGKGGSQQLVIETQFSPACKSWWSFLCYVGQGHLALSAVSGPRTALPDSWPLDSTSSQGANHSRLRPWSSSWLLDGFESQKSLWENWRRCHYPHITDGRTETQITYLFKETQLVYSNPGS